MSELKLPRLLAAAKEFNIGQDTLVEFLVKKGFNRDDLKPTAKLQEDQYYALQAEFQSDKVAKNKADQVEIPKGAQGEAKKKKDEEVVDEFDIDLDEFADEIEPWVIEEFKRIGCDTARSILKLTAEELERRTDLEKETIGEVRRILQEEFDREE